MRITQLKTSSRYFAAALFLIAVLPLPYGYYIFLRYAIFLIGLFNVLFFKKSQEDTIWLVLFISSAIIWNPFDWIMLYKAKWVPMNLVGAALYAICAVRPKS